MANVKVQEHKLHFTEWPTFMWKGVLFQHEINLTNPVDCDYRGMKFRFNLELSFGRFYNQDVYNLRIVPNNHRIPNEFEEFQVSICIIDEFGKEHFPSDAPVTRNVLISREPIWTANRMELFLQFTNQHHQEAEGIEEVLTMKCVFRPKYECENAAIVKDELSKASGTELCCKIAGDFLKLHREGSSTSDLTLRCKNITYKVHRLIMSTRCGVYLDKLLSKNEGFPIIEIDNMNPGILARILEFVYSGTLCDLNCDAACDLYAFGVEYSMDDLSLICRKYLMESLTKENARRILTIADQYEDLPFKKDVTQFIIKNPGILLSDDWDNVKPKLACYVYYEFVNRYDSVFQI